ncbi:NADPH-dependent FMN reductase [Streptosporangium roseum]|uniref:Reductase n=1 Tax=Streptosporangium roseum (strain ATCC 12428 / DSM 43021 / JCM 3005 / KCTC 9067 / NCIMB 10171 / NRRL 2505 / NI 9100) TaxID=479432 RepID=D2BCM8_STRRD|nr:NAD(P)H-dependent oxidoreductase [Streptosporangium roseum]ACZ91848.1 putative reductase [Streptosporangium roseum DSM 43021]
MIRIAVIVGSTRPGRRGETVARWVAEVAGRHAAVAAGEATVEVVDLAEYGLPLLDEPVPAAFGQYRNAHTVRWATTIDSFDGFVFVTPEYNHSVPAALKNAIDFLYAEWNDKAAGFVGYGIQGGIRAVEHLRLTLAEVKIAGVQTQVALSMFTDFEFTDSADPAEPGVCSPAEHQEATLNTMLSEVVTWSRALKPLRATATAVPQTVPA